jgi:LDH2 family malate/lactate/ureidoglycolate dehydrogenase
MQMLRFQAQPLLDLGRRIFEAVGAPADTARLVASALVEANLMGHDSHGVIRIPDYVKRAKNGQVRPAARPRVVSEHGGTALISGDWAFGQVTGALATDEAVRRAREFGVGAAAAVRCTHLGRMGAYVERAAAADCAAMVWVGGLGQRPAVPHGGSRPALGTNPVAAGFPVAGDDPVVMDFATTSVAAGKVMVALATGRELAPDVIVDSQGRPTRDPRDFVREGGLLPFGAHKGYAMSVVAELLGHALTGADRPGGGEPGEEIVRRSGALFLAIHVGAFRPADEAKAAARSIVTRLRSVPPASGVESVMTPGEPEARTRRARQAAGIEIPSQTWQAITTAWESVGLPADDLPGPAT